MTPHELKALESRITRANEDLAVLRTQRSDIDRRISERTAEANKCREILENARKAPKKITVSEHALLRYLERIKKIDLTKATREVLPDGLHDMALTHNGPIVVGNSHRVIMRSGTVSTVEVIHDKRKARKNKVKPWAEEED